jgi:predicted acyl esterase
MTDPNNLQGQLEYLGAELQKLEDKTLSRQAVSDAVASGMKQAVSSPDFWDACFEAMSKRTKSAAGGFLLDGVWGVARRALWFMTAGVAVYWLGGWTALVSLFKLFFGDVPGKP